MSELFPAEPREQAMVPMVPVANGWPLRICVGQGLWRTMPPGARRLAGVLFALPMGLLGVGVTGVAAAIGDASAVPLVAWFLALGGGLILAWLPLLFRLSTRLASRRLRRRAALHATAGSLRGSPPGSLVRVIGTVHAPEPFVSAVIGKPAVLALYEAGVGNHQVRGIDFILEVDGGESVRVAVRDAYLDESPLQETTRPADLLVVGSAGEATWREARIGPGDRVEVIGMLVREVDPTLAAGPGREPPLRWVIRAGAGMPLLVRRP
jgi:hypothetical protein